MKARTDELLLRWQKRFGLGEYSIDIQRVSLFQVSSEDAERCEGVGCSMVGIVVDHVTKQACIYHTRLLTEEDIVHELLHILNPKWTEQQVNSGTSHLLKNKNAGKSSKKVLLKNSDYYLIKNL